MDCFAMNDRGKCSILGSGVCQGKSCGFHKTKEEQERSLEKARERLRRLPEVVRDMVVDEMTWREMAE